MSAGLADALAASGVAWVLAIGLPLLIAPALLVAAWRSAALRMAPWAALPALGVAVSPISLPAFEAPWLLLGTRLGLDATARVFLVFTGLLWTAAGVYARAYLAKDAARHRFFAFFLLAMCGNLGLILAWDMAGFYLFFTLMSFAAYGLVIHDGTHRARAAGKVYLILVVVGEALLICALFLTAMAAGGLDLLAVAPAVAEAPAATRNLIVALVLAGFGIKAGVLPLHVWLPLAHPVAPTPASAVLSGAMIKAGLIGWLRFLPMGEATLPGWGGVCITVGLVSAFYGVAVGLTQDNPKTVLAYSSISQMGFITVGIGAGLMAPASWPLVLPAVLAYALHHALAKGALFLGVGVAGAASGKGGRILILAGLLLPALALAGAPFTSGAAAKLALKAAVGPIPSPWGHRLSYLLPAAAVGTALLMGRFLFLTQRLAQVKGSHPIPGLWVSWTGTLACVGLMPWLFVPGGGAAALGRTASYGAVWPIAVGAAVGWGAWRLAQRRAFRLGIRIPAGDLVMPLGWLAARFQRRLRTPVSALSTAPAADVPGRRRRIGPWMGALLREVDVWLGRWTTAGILFLFLTTVVFALLALT